MWADGDLPSVPIRDLPLRRHERPTPPEMSALLTLHRGIAEPDQSGGVALRGLSERLGERFRAVIQDAGHLPRGHGGFSVSQRAESPQVLETVHQARHRGDCGRVVVQNPVAPGADVEEESLREIGQRIFTDRIEQPAHFVRIHSMGATLPHPNHVLDGMQSVPRELSAPVLKAAALEKPLDDGDGHHDSDDLGSEIHQERSGARPDSGQERQPQHDHGDEEEATGYKRSKHDPALWIRGSARRRSLAGRQALVSECINSPYLAAISL